MSVCCSKFKLFNITFFFFSLLLSPNKNVQFKTNIKDIKIGRAIHVICVHFYQKKNWRGSKLGVFVQLVCMIVCMIEKGYVGYFAVPVCVIHSPSLFSWSIMKWVKVSESLMTIVNINLAFFDCIIYGSLATFFLLQFHPSPWYLRTAALLHLLFLGMIRITVCVCIYAIKKDFWQPQKGRSIERTKGWKSNKKN